MFYFSPKPAAIDVFMCRMAESKLCRFVCRCHGYVYTYRLYQDHGGSWAADVRHFIVFSLSTVPASTSRKKHIFCSGCCFVLFLFRCQPNLAIFEAKQVSEYLPPT